MYSTCTITLSENEEQVAWALETFPCLQLQPQVLVLIGCLTYFGTIRVLSIFTINKSLFYYRDF